MTSEYPEPVPYADERIGPAEYCDEGNGRHPIGSEGCSLVDEPDAEPSTIVTLLDGKTYDLVKLNEAMDAMIAQHSDGATRTWLVYSAGWEAGEAVLYTNGARFCIDNVLDPNDPEAWKSPT